MMRPWTIIYSDCQKFAPQCMEKSGPFGEASALTHFQQGLSQDLVILAMIPGCHKAQMVLPQYYMGKTSEGGQNAF